jgi:predicted metalloprotease with PDZ domain
MAPVDYTKENYTRLLWISEGFTEYYSGRILRQAGLLTVEEYLAGISNAIRDLQETPGRSVQSAADASFDAWIKFYRQDENSPNTTISYYLKGSLIALVLDLEIRHLTGERSLDDVMRLLYRACCRKGQPRFTAEEFRRICEQIAGAPLREILEDYCFGRSEISFARYLDYAGLKLSEPAAEAPARPRSYLGISAGRLNVGVRIVGVTAGSPAWESGLNVHDEIIAVDGFRVNQEILAALVDDSPPGAPLDFLVARNGRIRNIRVVPAERAELGYKIERIAVPTQRQKMLYESWLITTWEGAGSDG